MEARESRWQDIYLHLEKKGFSVYSPGTKTGDCLSRYVVLKNDGSSRLPSFSTDEDYYVIMCYVPKTQYSNLEVMVQEIKRAMKELEPMIFPAGYQSPSFYDDDIKAHMISIRYKNYKKML